MELNETKKYIDGYLLGDEGISEEVYIHLYNQVVNYKNISRKYPINFDYLCASALYILDKIKEDPEIAKTIKKYEFNIWKERQKEK